VSPANPAALVAAITLALAFVPAAPVPAAELGRLFLAPAERAALDRARHAEPAPVAAAVEEDPGITDIVIDETPAAVEPITVNGYVTRSGGPPTAWVNGTDTFQGDLSEIGIDSRRVRVEAAGVRLPVATTSGPVVLKPGQSFDPGSEAISDVYEHPPRE
jgi:hypothetical protein